VLLFNLQITISTNVFLFIGLGILAAIVVFLIVRLIQEKSKRKLHEAKHKALELKIQSMEVDSFKYKLNPHLFKNTLNSIQSHALMY
jgi:sensor histidine kinase YesM